MRILELASRHARRNAQLGEFQPRAARFNPFDQQRLCRERPHVCPRHRSALEQKIKQERQHYKNYKADLVHPVVSSSDSAAAYRVLGLEAVRALAIAAVIAYHLNIPG